MSSRTGRSLQRRFNGMKKPLAVAAALLALPGAFAAELMLAEGGKTSYTIVAPEKPSEIERAAVDDLARFLKESTGAEFKIGKVGEKNIFVGRPAPGDDEKLRPYERRVRAGDGNLYLYGEGLTGNAFAVYDFLEEFLGCRFYTIVGDMKIPKHPTLILPSPDFSRIPSIPSFRVTRWSAEFPAEIDFFRRSRLSEGLPRIGTPVQGHALPCYLPSGLIPYGERINGTFGPYKYFKDKKYFETNPEFFSLDKNGKRVPTMQFCFSNPAMRAEFFKNFEYTIEQEYRGGRAWMGVEHDDHGGAFCYCENCKKLEEKWGCLAGPYYDFLFDLCERFGRKYPDLLFTASAYRPEQTVTPPDSIKRLPANLGIRIATLNGVDFSKPLTHPDNRKSLEDTAKWSTRTDRFQVQLYPTPYPRPIVSFPLIANIHRVTENIRLFRDLGVWAISGEFGFRSFDFIGFAELRLYMIAAMVRNADGDETELIKDFMNNCYGPAGESMFQYYSELEKLQWDFPHVLRWNPDIRFLSYATPENLLRWEAQFDEMEALTRGNPHQWLNVRKIRYNLDQMTVACWSRLPADGRRQLGGLEKVVARAEEVSLRGAETIFASVADPAEREQRIRERVDRIKTGMDQFVAMARDGKPLPPIFSKFPAEHVSRLLPNRNKLGLDVDPAAPLGLCNTGPAPADRQESLFFMDYMDGYRVTHVQPEHPLTVERLEKAGPGYRYYYLGAARLQPDCMLSCHRVSPQSNVFLGHLFEPGAPDTRFDLYLMVNYDREKSEIRIGELVVVKRPDKRDGGDDKDRELDIVIHDFA